MRAAWLGLLAMVAACNGAGSTPAGTSDGSDRPETADASSSARADGTIVPDPPDQAPVVQETVCPCTTLAALIQQCPLPGGCPGSGPFSGWSCFPSGAKVEHSFIALGTGTLLLTERVFKPDGTLCYQRQEKLNTAADEIVVYTNAADQEIATTAASYTPTYVCDGMTFGPSATYSCWNNEGGSCALPGECSPVP